MLAACLFALMVLAIGIGFSIAVMLIISLIFYIKEREKEL